MLDFYVVGVVGKELVLLGEELALDGGDGEGAVEAFGLAHHVRVVVPVEFVALGDDDEEQCEIRFYRYRQRNYTLRL